MSAANSVCDNSINDMEACARAVSQSPTPLRAKHASHHALVRLFLAAAADAALSRSERVLRLV